MSTIPSHIDTELAVNCNWMDLCPICHKCMAVADEIYQRCYNCPFAYRRCKHTEAQRNFAIRRENFRVTISHETASHLKNLLDQL